MLDTSVERGMTPEEAAGPKKELIEERSAAFWTTLAPNVEDYSGAIPRAIAKSTGQVIKGIIWCGDVTADRLKWGEEFLKRKVSPGSKQAEVSRDALKRMKRYIFFPLFFVCFVFYHHIEKFEEIKNGHMENIMEEVLPTKKIWRGNVL